MFVFPVCTLIDRTNLAKARTAAIFENAMHNNSVGRHTLSKTERAYGGVEYREGASIYVRGYGILKGYGFYHYESSAAERTTTGAGKLKHREQSNHALGQLNLRYKGAAVFKQFGQFGWFKGIVDDIWESEESFLAHIHYEDGDKEDVTLGELKRILALEGSVNEGQGSPKVQAKTLSQTTVPAEVSSGFVFGYSGEKEKCVRKVQNSSNRSTTLFPLISKLVQRRNTPPPGLSLSFDHRFRLTQEDVLALWNFHAKSLQTSQFGETELIGEQSHQICGVSTHDERVFSPTEQLTVQNESVSTLAQCISEFGQDKLVEWMFRDTICWTIKNERKASASGIQIFCYLILVLMQRYLFLGWGPPVLWFGN